MKIKMNKILTLISLFIMLTIVLSNVAFATSGIKPNAEAAGIASFSKAMTVTIGLFQIVAIGMGAIMLIVLAIKYMSSAPSDKAEIKKHAVIYIVGACIAFGASGVVQILKRFTVETLK